MLSSSTDINDKRRCSAKTVKQDTIKSAAGVYEVNGISSLAASKFRTEHVFEVHLVSHFLEWLCAGKNELKYSDLNVKMSFPDKWTRPDSKWCEEVFGGKLHGDHFLAWTVS
jgi:hypothetical protein